MAEVRVLFDTVIDYMPQTRVWLSPDANIMESLASKAALVKILQEPANDLSEDEQAAV